MGLFSLLGIGRWNLYTKIMNYWETLQKIVDQSEIKIDRPKGSAHLRYPEYIYPFDYGELVGTSSQDGAGIDIWIGSQGGREVTAIINVIDQVKQDSEIKILLGCTEKDMQIILACHNRGGMSAMLIPKEVR